MSQNQTIMKTAEMKFHQRKIFRKKVEHGMMGNVYLFKSNKPLTERRRRERINNSLMQLKSLVLRATNKEENVKLEKADIMEMAVRYLEDQQQKQDQDRAHLAMQSFIQGYSACVSEVSNSLNVQWASNDIRSDVTNHLTTCLNVISAESQQHNFTTRSYSSVQPQQFTPRQTFVSDSNEYSFMTSTLRVFLPADDSFNGPFSSPFRPPSCSPSEPSSCGSASPSLTCFSSDQCSSGNSIPSPNQTQNSPVWRPW